VQFTHPFLQHWIEIDWRKHPGFKQGLSHEAIEDSIFKASIDQGALLICGSWFRAEKDLAEDKMFFRATYAAAPADKIEEAIKRFGDGLRSQFGL
jgi:aromatic amino acid aminotransferase I